MKKGFTVVELMVAVLILGLFVRIMFSLLNFGRSTFYQSMGLLDLQQNCRKGMDTMCKEIRQTSDAHLTVQNSGTEVVFRVPTNITADPASFSDTISYYLDDEFLIREHPPGITQTVAGNITGLTFTEVTGGLEIEFSAGKTVNQRTVSFELKEKVRLRN